MNTNSTPKPAWRFWLPLALQTLIILAVPAQAIYTHITGTTVILQTVPVDPYDILRGYYQTLNYDISRVENLKDLPGWDEVVTDEENEYLKSGVNLYVVLAAPETSSQSPDELPSPWKPVAISTKIPANLPANQVVLAGKSAYNFVNYGLEKYYLPEDQREDINNHIREVQIQSQEQEQIPFVVEIKVDNGGKAVPISLWVGEKNYRF